MDIQKLRNKFPAFWKVEVITKNYIVYYYGKFLIVIEGNDNFIFMMQMDRSVYYSNYFNIVIIF